MYSRIALNTKRLWLSWCLIKLGLINCLYKPNHFIYCILYIINYVNCEPNMCQSGSEYSKWERQIVSVVKDDIWFSVRVPLDCYSELLMHKDLKQWALSNHIKYNFVRSLCCEILISEWPHFVRSLCCEVLISEWPHFCEIFMLLDSDQWVTPFLGNLYAVRFWLVSDHILWDLYFLCSKLYIVWSLCFGILEQ